MREWAIVKPLVSLLFSRKFLVLLVAALASSGLAAAAGLGEWIPIIIMVGASLNGVLIAWEDAAAKRGGNEPQ